MTPDSPACTCQVLGTTGVHYHSEENHLLNTVLWLLHVTVHACPHTPATRQIKEWHAGQPHGLAGRGACYQFCWAGVQPPQCTKYQERADLYKLSSDRHISTVAGTCSPNQPFLKTNVTGTRETLLAPVSLATSPHPNTLCQNSMDRRSQFSWLIVGELARMDQETLFWQRTLVQS